MSPEDQVGVEGPMGFKLTANGKSATAAIVLASCVGLLVYLILKGEDANAKDHESLKQQVSEIVYVLSLPQGEREKLNLSMPETLRQKVRRRRDSE